MLVAAIAIFPVLAALISLSIGKINSGSYSYTTMKSSPLQRITLDPDICHGKPCVRGLRYPVEFILELLSSGMSMEEILSDYDDLEREDILAVLLYAARLSQLKSIYKIA